MASGEKQTSKKPATLPPSVLTTFSKLTLRTPDRTRVSRETPMEIEENGTTIAGVTADPSTAMDTSEPPDLTTVQEVWVAIERGRSRVKNEADKQKTGKDTDKECTVVVTENAKPTTCDEEEGGEMQATVRQLRYNAGRAERTIRAVRRTKELREQGRTTTEAIKEAMSRTKRGKKKVRSPDYLQMQETFTRAVEKLKRAEELDERQEVMRAVMEQTDTEIGVYEAMIKELEKEKEDLGKRLKKEQTAHNLTKDECEARTKTIERMTQEYGQLLAIYNKQVINTVRREGKRRETDRSKGATGETSGQEEQKTPKAEAQEQPKMPNLNQLFKMNNDQVEKYVGKMTLFQYYALDHLPTYRHLRHKANPWKWGEKVINKLRQGARQLDRARPEISKDRDEGRVEIDASIVLYIRRTIKELLQDGAFSDYSIYKNEKGKEGKTQDDDFYQILEMLASKLPHNPRRYTHDVTADDIWQKKGETIDQFLERLACKIQEQMPETSPETLEKRAKETTEILMDHCRIEYRWELIGRVGIRPAKGETVNGHRERVIQELREAEQYVLNNGAPTRRITVSQSGWREERTRVQREHTGYAVARAPTYLRKQGQQWDGDTESETTRGDESEDGEWMSQHRDNAWCL